MGTIVRFDGENLVDTAEQNPKPIYLGKFIVNYYVKFKSRRTKI